MVCLCKGIASKLYLFLQQFADFEEFDRKVVELGVALFGKSSAELGIWLSLLIFAIPFGGVGFVIGLLTFDKDVHCWFLKSPRRVRWFLRIYRLLFKEEPRIPGTPWILHTPMMSKRKRLSNREIVETAC